MALPLPAVDGAVGNQTYTVLPVCTCSHGAYFHELIKGVRKSCSAWFGSKCTCRTYEPKETAHA